MYHNIEKEEWSTRLFASGDVCFADGGAPEIYLAKLGHFQSKGGFSLQQVPTQISIHCVTGGQGKMQVGGKPYQVGAGDLFVFFPGEHVVYFDEPEHPWVYTWFMLRGRRANVLLQQCGFAPNQPYRKNGYTEALSQTILYADDCLSQPAVSPLILAELACRFLDKLAAADAATTGSLCAQARALCEQPDGMFLNVNELSDALRVSRITLFRAFRDAYGLSPKQVLDQMRMERARALLTQSSALVKQIAAMCGYRNETYFSRVFRERFGMAPGAWRRYMHTTQPPSSR